MDFEQRIRPTQLQSALIEYARAILWTNPVAVTLTLKQRVKQQAIDVYVASANFRHFMARLNRKVFGNLTRRHNKGLKVIPVLEHDELVRFHNHAVIDTPDNMDFAEFKNAIEASWEKTAWAYDQTEITPMTDDGWLHYIAKMSQKPEYDLAIDWMNVRAN